jgi:hypothetical protein
MTENDYRSALWRYTEVSNALMALSMGATGVKLAESAVSYLYKSNYSFKPVNGKLTTADRMGPNVAKALQESAEQPKHHGAREATFTLSTQWTPKGYIYGGPEIVSWAPGWKYSSRINVKLRFEVMEYIITLEGKKDKDKDKDKAPPIDYEKLSTAIAEGMRKGRFEDREKEPDLVEVALDEAPKKEKEKKEPFSVTILENASMTLGEGTRQLGWGTKLDLTGEIYVGRDSQDPGSVFYEFKIIWSESSATAAFNDTLSIKCYVSGKVEVSSNFSQACDTADDVKAKLAVDAGVYKILSEGDADVDEMFQALESEKQDKTRILLLDNSSDDSSSEDEDVSSFVNIGEKGDRGGKSILLEEDEEQLLTKEEKPKKVPNVGAQGSGEKTPLLKDNNII